MSFKSWTNKKVGEWKQKAEQRELAQEKLLEERAAKSEQRMVKLKHKEELQNKIARYEAYKKKVEGPSTFERIAVGMDKGMRSVSTASKGMDLGFGKPTFSIGMPASSAPKKKVSGFGGHGLYLGDLMKSPSTQTKHPKKRIKHRKRRAKTTKKGKTITINLG